MQTQTIYLPDYTVGEDAYDKIGYITKAYGTKAVVIGGKTAIEKAKPALSKGVENSLTVILDFLWYGGDATMANVHRLAENHFVKEADMLFAVGGGRACDTVKVLGALTGKPVFTFPTLASNCAACTSLSVMYNEDGSFDDYSYQNRPALHTFINTQIIAESPEELFWAGIGDALSKECEVEYCCREKQLTHLPLLGLGIAKTCTAPLLMYGEKALEDCRNNRVSPELEEVVLDIVMLTGIVSNCAVHISDQIAPEDQYYYNSSLAHCVYYGSSLIPTCESHLHGEIVSFGVLCLLKYDNNMDEFNKILAFNKALGLPITMADIGLTAEDLPVVAEKAVSVIEWKYLPGNPTKEKFIQSILDTDRIGQSHK